MTIQEFRDYMASGKPVIGGGDVHMMFHQLSQEALKITAEINGKYHTPEELHDLLEQLWGREVPKSMGMFPPFHTDCGKNTVVGERVFINMGCKFQDQGGITIDEGALIGHNVVLATIKRVTGHSVTSYIDRHTIPILKSYLNDERLSLTQIAEIMNFTTLSYFSRYCTKHLGQSPSEYRLSLQPK